MPNSKVTYTGNGATTNRSVTFGYLDAAHVFVTVDGVSTSFTWSGAATVVISPAPAADTEIVIYRVTPRTTPIATLVDGAVDKAEAYNDIALQMLYSAQEIEDDISIATESVPAGGAAGQVLVKQSGINYDATWDSVAGTGDVVGPASVTDDLPAVFDLTTGKLLKQKTYAAFKTLLALVKGDVGLGSVDNTADTAKPVSTVQQTALDLKANIASPTFTGTVAGITKAMVGLTSADDTSDAGKPVSTAQQTALNLKSDLAGPTFTGVPAAPTAAAATSTTQIATTAFATTADNLKANLASPTFTGTVAGITKAMVGLTSVDDTADTAKPVSTAQQTALDLKSNLAGPTFTGVPAAPTAAAATSTTQLATTAFATTADALKANIASPTFTGTVAGITKAMVGLTSVDDTSDAAKPVSTAQQTALNLKANLASPTFTGTVSGITKAMVGLTSVDDTSDAGKPVSTATQTALNLKSNLVSPTFTGTVAVPDASWSLAKLANIATARFLGRTTAASGVVEELTAAQATAMLSVVVGDSGAGGAKGLVPATVAGDSTKFLRGDATFVAIPGGGDALVSGNLSQFAATTSLQLKTLLSDETGSGAAVFATSPALVTPTGIVKGDVGLGSVDNTTDAGKPVSTATQTALDLKSNLAGPTFTGVPAAPTAAAATNTTQLATTAFVTTADNLKANLADPTFTGVPAAPTAAAATSTTQIATTAFATTADNLKANIASPTFTGTVTIPTGGVLAAPALTDPVITGAILADRFTITDAASFVIDPSNGEFQQITLGASRTPAAASLFNDGETVSLWIADGTAYAITWSTVPVVWKDGTAPTLATTGWTEVSLTKQNGVIRGVHVGDFAS